MEVSISVRSNIDAVLRRKQRWIAQAATAAVKATTTEIKMAMRQQVQSAGLGTRLANTWRSRVYPESGYSIEAAGWIWTKAYEIMAGLDAGHVIVPKHGTFLAIPTREVQRFRAGGGRGHGYRKTQNYPAIVAQQMGVRLQFIPLPNGNAMLAADKSEIAAAKGKRGPRRTEKLKSRYKVYFWLVRQVRGQKRIDIEAVRRRIRPLLRSKFETELASRAAAFETPGIAA